MAGNKILAPAAMNLVAARFKVLSDPMRLRILNALQESEQSVTGVTDNRLSFTPQCQQASENAARRRIDRATAGRQHGLLRHC